MPIKKFLEIAAQKSALKFALIAAVGVFATAKVVTTLDSAKDYFALTPNHANLQYNVGDVASVLVDTKITPKQGAQITYDATLNNAPISLRNQNGKTYFQMTVSSYGTSTLKITAYLENAAETMALRNTLGHINQQISQIDDLINQGSTDPRLPLEKSNLLVQKAEYERKIAAQRQYVQDKSLTLFTLESRPHVAFTATGQSVTQTPGQKVTISAVLDNSSSQTVTVPYIVSGTATSADDDLVSGSLTFPPGRISQDIIVNLSGNPSGSSKSAIITLQESPSATLGNINTFTLTINDPTISVPTVSGVGYEIETSGIPSYVTLWPSNISAQDSFKHIKMEFGDGKSVDLTHDQFGISQGFRHLYTSNGPYTVKVTIFSETEQASPTYTQDIQISGLLKPIPGLTVTPSADGTSVVTFDASSSQNPNSNGPLSYYWNFGDGSEPDSQSGAIVAHTFNVPSNISSDGQAFNVQLFINTETAETSNVTIPVVMSPDGSMHLVAPIPILNQTMVVGTVPLHLQIDSSKSIPGPSPIISKIWDLGDQNAFFPTWQVGDQADYTYNSPGTYQVTFFVKDQAGNLTQQGITVIAADPSAPLQPKFYAVNGGGNMLDFSIGVYGNQGAIDHYGSFWDFGDGSAISGSRYSQREYTPNDQAYFVRAIGYDIFGNPYTVGKNIKVRTDNQNAFPNADTSANAHLYFDAVNAPLAFTGSSFSDPNNLALTMDWYFCGNQNFVELPSQSSFNITFLNPGICNIGLYATNSEGRSTFNFASPILSSAIGPISQASVSALVGAAPLTVNFVNKSVPGANDITNSIWRFGDYSSGQDASVTGDAVHTYVNPGTYYTQLSVQDTSGNATAFYAPIMVVDPASIPLNPPVPTFGFTPTVEPQHISVMVTDHSSNSTPDYEIYTWDYGDGLMEIHNEHNTFGHFYNAPGTYTLTGTMTNAYGKTTTVSQQIIVPASTALGAPAKRTKLQYVPQPSPIDYNNQNGCVQVGSVIHCNINGHGGKK